MVDNSNHSAEALREYSVEEAVPQAGRHYSFWDMVATWLGANANTSSWYTGGCVAAAGVLGGLGVILIANPIAYAVMALIGYMGYKVGTTTMGLTRASFGIRGSILPSVLNSIQFMGWCAINTFIAAISLSFLFNMAFGWPAYGEPGSWWVMVIGVVICSILQILMTVLGGSYSIKYAQRIAVILLFGLLIWETVVILKTYPLADIFNWAPAADSRIPFGSAMDMMVAFSFGWIPAIAEFTRYTKTKSASTIAPMIGANFALFWFAIIGMFGVVANAIANGVFDPNMSDPSSIVGSLGLGWVAFLILIFATTTTNCINIYAAGMSATNIFPKLSEKKALWGTSVLTLLFSLIPVAIGSFYGAFTYFLVYIGLIFAPLLAIMIIDFYVIKKRNYDWSQAAKVGGAFWYSHGINWIAIVSWCLGVAFYFVALNLSFIMNSMGAIYATVIVTSIVYLVANKLFNKKTYQSL